MLTRVCEDRVNIALRSQGGQAIVSSENFSNNALGFYPGQTLLETLEGEGESFVIDPHAMENRCVDIVDMYRIFGDVVTVIVGRSEFDPTLDPAAGHPHAETLRMMVSTVIGLRQTTLAIDGSTELSAPND